LQPVPQADVVMLGDSLTAWPVWLQLLSGYNVANCGVYGDKTADVLERLDDVLSRRPKVVFLLIGINDLASGSSPEEVAANIAQIVRRLQLAGCRVVLQSIVYTRHPIINERFYCPEKITRCNELLERINCGYLDLNAVLSEGQEIKEDFTTDGVHFTDLAYVRWAKVVRQRLDIVL
jgi:lysophospholipase L1-like esterase